MNRLKTIIQNYSKIFSSFFFKGIAIVFNFLIIRYSIEYLGEEKYGIWITMFSFFLWFSALESGISSSFRNKITETFSKNKNQARKSLKKAYTNLSIVFAVIIIVCIGLTFLFPINLLFGTKTEFPLNIRLIFQLSLTLYFAHYIVFFLNYVLLSTHRAQDTYIITAIQSGLLTILIFFLAKLSSPPSLLIYCLFCTAVPLVTWLVANFYFFNTKLKPLKPTFSFSTFKNAKPLKSINKDYIIIQACTLILYSTDNFIIINYLQGYDVTIYNLVFKYFNILIVIFNIILLPNWAFFSEAFLKKEIQFIEKRIKRLLSLLLILSICGVLMLFISQHVFMLWIGKEIQIPTSLSIFTLISMMLTCWNYIFYYFLGAINETKNQKNIFIISASLNIPLSLILIQVYDSTGVIIATCLSLLPLSIYLPLSYLKKLKSLRS